MQQLTETQRQILLDRAIDAVRALCACGPSTDPDELVRAGEAARMAVTDATGRGGHIHTLISAAVGCTGLAVVRLIEDWSAQAQALGVERHAAEQYMRLVQLAAGDHVRQRQDAQGRGAVDAAARDMGATRQTLYRWVAMSEELDSSV